MKKAYKLGVLFTSLFLIAPMATSCGVRRGGNHHETSSDTQTSEFITSENVTSPSLSSHTSQHEENDYLYSIFGDDAIYKDFAAVNVADYPNVLGTHHVFDKSNHNIGIVYILEGTNNYGKMMISVGIYPHGDIGRIYVMESEQSFADKIQSEYVDKYNNGEIALDDVLCGATFGAKLIRDLAKQAQAFHIEKYNPVNPDKPKEMITMWVGSENYDFSKHLVDQFLKENPAFKYDIGISSVDIGATAGAMYNDNTACADIITIANDNIAKLSAKSLIRPITDNVLIDQIARDNPETFINAVTNKLGTAMDAKEYIFGAPIASQSLFLIYNKKHVQDYQALSFEGLREAAQALSPTTKAITLSGTDAYNFSFTTLARREADFYTSVRLFENSKLDNTFYQGNDTVAITRWAQDYFNQPNGGLLKSMNTFYEEMKNEHVLSVIGGTWHLPSVIKAIGKENVGCAPIPTFKLMENHVEGLTSNSFDSNVPQAGDIYRGGTFLDCKALAINMASKEEKLESIQQIIQYFASKKSQSLAFAATGNVPAYLGAEHFIDSIKGSVDPLIYESAKSQSFMARYCIPQPFKNGITNTYYYSKGADWLLADCITNKDGNYIDINSVRQTLYNIEYIWRKGRKPYENEIPEVLPANII